MSNLLTETVTSVRHWNETLFSFTTTRKPDFRFRNGYFTMIGLPQASGRPLLRAYSITSANYADELEFFSIKVPDGPLTSQLQKIQPGDQVFVSSKATGTLVTDHLLPGKHLYLLSTGTGLAPFLSIIQDPEIYERFDRIILTHGVRYKDELAYQQFITEDLPNNEFFGEEVRSKLLYYPTVTRENYSNQGRLTDLLATGTLEKNLGLPPINIDDDRFMLCGSPSMLKDFCAILDARGFKEVRHGDAAHYVIERAFVE